MILRMIDEIEALKHEINKEFKCDLVQLHIEGASKALRCALWARANILLITCLRDGLCLQPLEFLAVK
jgi:trehalose-6-phosphate synthase